MSPYAEKAMKIIEITSVNRKRYDAFVLNHPLGSIHQTLEWGIFQSGSGRRDKFRVFAAEDEDGQIMASALVIRQVMPFNKCWLYCPRGPLGDYSKKQNLTPLFNKIKELAHSENAVFLRFDPPLEESFHPRLKEFFKTINARPAHAHYQPESTLILDLKHAPEELLRRMKPKGRYNIKVAQKHGVKVRVSDGNKADMEAFYALLRRTAQRDRFSGHPQSYYKKMLEVLGPQKARLYLAEYDGKLLAGMIATYFAQTATYYFGASSDEHRNTMAPYLLHWQAINDARAAGYHYYDFFGIAPVDQPGHPWAKVTDFKLKFGGERVDYMQAYEIVYRPLWYTLIKLAKVALKIIKRK